MKSPKQIRQQLSKQWHNANHRIELLLGVLDEQNQRISAFPITIKIGKPTNKAIEQETDKVKHHFQAWREFSKLNIATVTWETHIYRATNEEISYPNYLIINTMQEWYALLLLENDKQQMQQLLDLLNHNFVQAWQTAKPTIAYAQLSLLIRQLKLISNYDINTLIQVLLMANLLSKNCANGLPLRALTLDKILTNGIDLAEIFSNYLPLLKNNLDSKFLENHRKLLCLLLATRFDNISNSKTGLEEFLNADKTGVHWLLLAEFSSQKQWLPFQQMRLRDTDLANITNIPFETIVIVENEQCLYQLQAIEKYGLLDKVLVVLGAGNNLTWLANSVWADKKILYWGDIDSWGLAILSQARALQPHIIAVMMDEDTLQQHQNYSVIESNSYSNLPQFLTEEEQKLFQYLITDNIRLEQEFIAVEWVKTWLKKF